MSTSTMPGVGSTPPSSGHSMLPMNVMAQKVMPGGDPGSMKPLSGTNLSYVTLQPASQPLSLVQDHRSQVYPSTPYNQSTSTPATAAAPSNINPASEREISESTDSKSVQNGLESSVKAGVTAAADQESNLQSKQNQEANRNNNISPESSSIESQDDIKSDPQPSTFTDNSGMSQFIFLVIDLIYCKFYFVYLYFFSSCKYDTEN